MLQNLREAIQTQFSRAGSSARPLLPTHDAGGERDRTILCSPRDKHGGAEHRHIVRMANRRLRQAIFDRVHSLRRDGKTVSEIVRQTGFDRRTIGKRIQSDVLPHRNASAPKTSSPCYFEGYLSRRWAEGCVRAEGCLARSEPKATAEASQIRSACWQNGALRNTRCGE